jgi:hypothetical protein
MVRCQGDGRLSCGADRQLYPRIYFVLVTLSFVNFVGIARHFATN